MRLINLTPHPVKLGDVELPSEGVARVETETYPLNSIQLADATIPACVRITKGITGLPEPRPDIKYIVSQAVFEAARKRTDLYYLTTSETDCMLAGRVSPQGQTITSLWEAIELCKSLGVQIEEQSTADAHNPEWVGVYWFDPHEESSITLSEPPTSIPSFLRRQVLVIDTPKDDEIVGIDAMHLVIRRLEECGAIRKTEDHPTWVRVETLFTKDGRR